MLLLPLPRWTELARWKFEEQKAVAAAAASAAKGGRKAASPLLFFDPLPLLRPILRLGKGFTYELPS